MNRSAPLHVKKRKDFIPYFLGFVIFLYCTVHVVWCTAGSAPGPHRRLRRALGKDEHGPLLTVREGGRGAKCKTSLMVVSFSLKMLCLRGVIARFPLVK